MMKKMKKLMMLIFVAMLISATANSVIVFAEETYNDAYETFSYYDADRDINVVEYYYGNADCDNGYYETFSYYDADKDIYVIEYYYYDCDDDSEETEYEQSGYVPDYSDLYQDEYQAAWYSPAMVNDWADFYSMDGEYICSIPSGTYVQPLESVGRSGDITYILYDDCEGYIYTVFLINPSYEVTYDEINQSDNGIMVQLVSDANLRDEYGNILTTIPAGYGVNIISYDDTTGRYWITWNGRFGSIIASAIWSNQNCYYVDDAEDEACYDDDVDYYSDEECSYEENFGYARIKPLIGANVRDLKNNIITAIPHAERVMLLEPLNIGGRTLIKWGAYVGTVLTSCLKAYSA